MRVVNTHRWMFDFGWTSIDVTTSERLTSANDLVSKRRVVELWDTMGRCWTLVACPDGTMIPVEVWQHGYEGSREHFWALDPRHYTEHEFVPCYLRNPANYDPHAAAWALEEAKIAKWETSDED